MAQLNVFMIGLALFHFLVTDPEIIGVVAWVGLLATVVGFVIAFAQLARVKSASVAAKNAVAGIRYIVRSHEQSARLATALDHLKSADEQLRKPNIDAASAYLSVGWNFLLEAKELTASDEDRTLILMHAVTIRRLYDNLRSSPDLFTKSPELISEGFVRLNKSLDELGGMAARIRFSLSGIGASKNE